MQRKLLTNGNTFKRTDNRWGGVVWCQDEKGERKRKSFSGTTKQEVNQKITDYLAAFTKETLDSNESRKTLRESMQKWLEVFKFPSVVRTTYDRCECTARHQVYPTLGDIIISDITAADVKALLNQKMNEGYAYTTVKKLHVLLGEYFRYLTQQEIIVKNPMSSAPMIKRATSSLHRKKKISRSTIPLRYSRRKKLRSSRLKRSVHGGTASGSTSRRLYTPSCSIQDCGQENCSGC